MSDDSIHLSSGLPSTALGPDPLDDVVNVGLIARDDLAILLAEHPRSSIGWAALGEATSDVIERYAYFRVGYHRGLDALRAAGWRGSGFVRWSDPGNRGFLRCLDGLRAAAAEIGEDDEAHRCAQFLLQLDPDWSRR